MSAVLKDCCYYYFKYCPVAPFHHWGFPTISFFEGYLSVLQIIHFLVFRCWYFKVSFYLCHGFCVCGKNMCTFLSGNQKSLLENISSSGDTVLFIHCVDFYSYLLFGHSSLVTTMWALESDSLELSPALPLTEASLLMALCLSFPMCKMGETMAWVA